MSFNPISTYRIQFHKDFTFSDFEKIIPYLDELGVKTIYASPIFEAMPGSTHGYDGTDPNKINPEIGTEEQLRSIAAELKKRSMYWLQDIVPNHLAFHENNRWLMDVLGKGQASEYAQYFDIIWDHPEFKGKLMVPFPGSPLEEKLKNEFPGADHYVLVPWQITDNKINYRRFFLVNGLICTNVHDDKVFGHYHQLIKRLSDEKIFDGLRVDHIDGLYDPTKYLNDLRRIAGDNSYIVVEKILEPGEKMPQNWPVEGTSGYDFLGMVNNLFTNRNAEFEFTALYYELTGDKTPVEKQIKEKKSYILHHHFCGELDNLTNLYKECGLAAENISDEEIKKLIADYLISCPVYRYYDNSIPVMEGDKGKNGAGVKKFYTRCMQFTGPLMAKGVEDTLMYTYNRFAGHNEVGDSSEFFGYTIDEFHTMMKERQQLWPLSMNGSSTHDTKRGEDVRARLNALSCFPYEWTNLVHEWITQNENLKSKGWPDKNDEYFIYQTLLGSYPDATDKDEIAAYPGRLAEYFQKALREAKVHSNWAEPNAEYEQACIDFTNKLLDDPSFKKSFLPFLEKISSYGMINSLAQVVLKFTCPGVPDIYQGTELWDLSLVDPDNRRPVDFDKRKEILKNGDNDWRSGEIKLSVVHQLLTIRNEFAEVFLKGEYIPLKVAGKYSDHVLAFMRKHGRSAIIVIAPVTYALINSHQVDFTEALHGLIPEDVLKRQLLHVSDLLQIVHVDLVA